VVSNRGIGRGSIIASPVHDPLKWKGQGPAGRRNPSDDTMSTTSAPANPKPRRRWLQFSLRPLLVVVVLICSIPCGCTPALHRGIVYTGSADPFVHNGTAFDRAELELGEHHTVVIPTRAALVRATRGNSIVIELEKSLGFVGHPGKRFTIDEARRDMGCAWLSKDGQIRLATFGEFSCGDGGKSVALEVTVPEGIAVERDDRHEMSRADGYGARGSKLRQSQDGGETWYAPEGSEERWHPVADVPNPERASQHNRGR